MRHTLMLNLDDRHAKQLDDLSRHFRLAAEDTVRFAIRLAHARYKQKADVLIPELKPRAARRTDPDEFEPR
ncbi:hypothetical protein EDD52_11590 [Primorskyibacter sedentarius]|uniref:CopG family transcriptional regulator n=1 Tax=Primorskyibacter sedentarius TaxID=745311 RepID=A0A4R3J736_9RHOB|nr:hypothetical protein [Primorskyibacter sedentarius]TCS60270.1 hypothetical protein EDD52_11590 [Primorskyibacter sedentarius]